MQVYNKTVLNHAPTDNQLKIVQSPKEARPQEFKQTNSFGGVERG